MKLEGRVAVVTGGATGIGRAVCELFAQEGARVVINYSESHDAAEEVASVIRNSGGQTVTVRASVAVDADVRNLMRSAEEHFGRLDILVNNAGWSKRTPHHRLEDLTDDLWDRTLDTNLRGVFYSIRAAVPLLRKQSGASIVNIASGAAYTGGGSTIAYAASKAGVLTMTKSFARVLAPDVRVNAIAPGLVHTRFAGWPEETFVTGAAHSPLKRIATPEEVAKAALFLVGDATATTGETIRVDCGVTSLGGA